MSERAPRPPSPNRNGRMPKRPALDKVIEQIQDELGKARISNQLAMTLGETTLARTSDAETQRHMAWCLRALGELVD
jgi:tRNA 2-selenouridine synthase SelU